MLRGCDATFFVIYASSGKQRYVSPIYSMRPVSKSNARDAIINTSHVIEVFCVCCRPDDASLCQTNQTFNTIDYQIHSPRNYDAAADVEIQGHPHSYAKIGWDTHKIYFEICNLHIAWLPSLIIVTYPMFMHIMHYWIRMHKLFPQVGITTIRHFGLTYAFDRALLLGHLIILKILLPRMPHLGAQTGCRAGRRRTCHMDHQTCVRASPKADGSSG